MDYDDRDARDFLSSSQEMFVDIWNHAGMKWSIRAAEFGASYINFENHIIDTIEKDGSFINLELKNDLGENLLEYCIRLGYEKAGAELIRHDPSFITTFNEEYQYTPLMDAVYYGRVKIFDALTESTLDDSYLNMADCDEGFNALHIIANEAGFRRIDFQGASYMAEKLLDLGVNPALNDKYGDSFANSKLGQALLAKRDLKSKQGSALEEGSLPDDFRVGDEDARESVLNKARADLYVRAEKPLPEDLKQIEKSQEFDYRLLSRMVADNKYFLGAGNGYEKHLWAGSVKEQIEKMYELYDKLIVKPQWLILDDIRNFERDMNAKLFEILDSDIQMSR